MPERYKFPVGNTVGVVENLTVLNKDRFELQRERIDRFKELVKNGEASATAKKIVIKEFKLDRTPNAGTPRWMTIGKEELIAEGFDYKAGPFGPENTGGKKRAYDRRKDVIYTFDDRLKKAKTKVTKGTDLGKAYELSHTANIFQAKNLGLAYPIDSLAIQPQNINNKVAEALNEELKPLYKKQLDLFKQWTGFYPTRVDGYQNAHVAKGVPEIIAPVLQKAGVVFTRIPDENIDILHWIDEQTRLSYESQYIQMVKARLVYAHYGIRAPDKTYDIGLKGKEMTLERIQHILDNVEGNIELVVHPGFCASDAQDKSPLYECRVLYSRIKN